MYFVDSNLKIFIVQETFSWLSPIEEKRALEIGRSVHRWVFRPAFSLCVACVSLSTVTSLRPAKTAERRE